MQREPESDAQCARDQESLHRKLGPRLAKPHAGDQTQDHRGQRGDEAKCQVTTRVVFKSAFARKQVQKPLVEVISKVEILVPVRRESGEIVLRIPLR